MANPTRPGTMVQVAPVRSIPSTTAAGLLLLGGIAAFGASMTSHATDGHILFFGLSVGLVSVALFALALRSFLRTPDEVADSVFDHLTKNIDTAAAVTSAEGVIRRGNGAFDLFPGNSDDRRMVGHLSHLTYDPDALVYRMLNGVADKGNARECMLSPDDRVWLVTARTCSDDNIIWQFDEVPQATTPGSALPVDVATPILTTNGFGDVTWLNPAAQALCDGPENIRDLVPDGDGTIASGTRLKFPGADPSDYRLIRRDLDDSRAELILLPDDTEDLSGSGLERLFDTMPVALARVDSHGVITAANDELRGLVGPGAEPGARLDGLMEGLGRSIKERIGDMIRGRSHLRAEMARAVVDGHEVYLQVTLKRLHLDGHASILAVISDATELKSLENQFVQSQKMQAVGQLAGGVAHDFNNLLTAINGHCDLLLIRHQQGDTDYGDLIQIRQNANRAASLVGQLLAFSRKQTLLPRVLDLYNTFSELTLLLNRLLGEKVTLRIDNGADLKPVRVDERQMEQVIMNLVVNARDAMPNGGEVRICTRNVYFKEDQTRDRAVIPFGDYVQIDVIDTGTGIPDDKVGKIFEPFFTTKKTGEGTGLGLSTVYGIVKQTGGFIFADSEIGRGTTFTILLPVHAGDAIEAVVPDATPEREPRDLTGRGVILLVEDEVPVRSFAARALNLRGYTVVEAASAEEALDILEDDSLHVDVFVSDVIMPGMDGPTWVKEAQKTRPDTKVVFVSGYAEDVFEGGELTIPNASFLPKPFSLNELTEMVKAQVTV